MLTTDRNLDYLAGVHPPLGPILDEMLKTGRGEGIPVVNPAVGRLLRVLVTALAPKVGYDKAALIAHTAHVDKSSLREAALKLKHLTEEEFDQLMKPERMPRP